MNRCLRTRGWPTVTPRIKGQGPSSVYPIRGIKNSPAASCCVLLKQNFVGVSDGPFRGTKGRPLETWRRVARCALSPGLYRRYSPCTVWPTCCAFIEKNSSGVGSPLAFALESTTANSMFWLRTVVAFRFVNPPFSWSSILNVLLNGMVTVRQ